jgi:endonuclease/exonuclease/phosphatase family metal-dependent hydrolase
MTTWVKFHDLKTQSEFYFWNTHLDHESQASREKSAALILQRINQLGTKLPIILSGDFNAESRANPAYDTLIQAGFTDTWFAAEKRVGQNYASFHGYEKPVADGPHIDWILTRGDLKTASAQVVSFQQRGQYPSDHFPVMATLHL